MVPDGKIKVNVHDGWITLEGTVSHTHERKAAENAIRNLTGVKGLSNLISVESQFAGAA
jgi:osmotically-inducible protein OsmY